MGGLRPGDDKKIGLDGELASPRAFKHRARNMWPTVYGCEIALLGSDVDSRVFEGYIEKRSDVNATGRPGAEDARGFNQICGRGQDGLRQESN
eukprot:5283483-Pyramimonas_sp.AAC.1